MCWIHAPDMAPYRRLFRKLLSTNGRTDGWSDGQFNSLTNDDLNCFFRLKIIVLFSNIFTRFFCIFASSLRKLCLHEQKTKFKILVSEIYVCVCVCVCVRARVCVRSSTFQTPITHKRLEILTWNLVHRWSNHNPLIVTVFFKKRTL